MVLEGLALACLVKNSMNILRSVIFGIRVFNAVIGNTATHLVKKIVSFPYGFKKRAIIADVEVLYCFQLIDPAVKSRR
jgi:hypothetical protein